MSPGKTEVKQDKFVEFISPAKGYFKSQNINPISLTPKFSLGIRQIKVIRKPINWFTVRSLKKIPVQFQPDPEVRCV